MQNGLGRLSIHRNSGPLGKGIARLRRQGYGGCINRIIIGGTAAFRLPSHRPGQNAFRCHGYPGVQRLSRHQRVQTGESHRRDLLGAWVNRPLTSTS